MIKLRVEFNLIDFNGRSFFIKFYLFLNIICIKDEGELWEINWEKLGLYY